MNKNNIVNWLLLSRLPFHSVGIMPFILGTFIAYKINNIFHLAVFIWALIAVIFIMLSTNLNGEYCDLAEDKLALREHKSNFAGGSRVLAENKINPQIVKKISYISIILAIIIGLILQFFYKTGIYTIALGVIGIICGFFYSKPPLRWVNRGLGELMIAICYGFLPVAVGYYLQTGYINFLIFFVSLPIAGTIFNVILINEYPDYSADRESGKKNLLVRLGKIKASYLYILINFLVAFTFMNFLFKITKFKFYYLYLPILFIQLLVSLAMLTQQYRKAKFLEVLCGLTILINLYITSIYIFVVAAAGKN